MTEEIIVDGVIVAGCKYYDNGICCNDDVLTLSCDKTNCMYKQLKRLEQENRELKAYKDVNEDFKQAWDELNEKYKQLRSALEEIREIEELAYYPKGMTEIPLSQRDFILNAINNYEQRRIKILTKINEVLTP